MGQQQERELYNAVSQENDERAKALLEAGVPPTYQDSWQNTCLHEAVEKRNPQLITLLLEHGANPAEQNIFNRTPIYRACLNADEKRWECILAFAHYLKEHPQQFDPALLALALFHAIQNKKDEIAKVLLEAGGPPTYQDESQNTCLHEAVKNKNPEIVKLLIKYGASTTEQNHCHWTPYEVAQQKSNIECVEVFSELSKAMHQLREAVRAKNVEKAKSLLEDDSLPLWNPDIISTDMLNEAILSGSYELVKLFLDHPFQSLLRLQLIKKAFETICTTQNPEIYFLLAQHIPEEKTSLLEHVVQAKLPNRIFEVVSSYEDEAEKRTALLKAANLAISQGAIHSESNFSSAQLQQNKIICESLAVELFGVSLTETSETPNDGENDSAVFITLLAHAGCQCDALMLKLRKYNTLSGNMSFEVESNEVLWLNRITPEEQERLKIKLTQIHLIETLKKQAHHSIYANLELAFIHLAIADYPQVFLFLKTAEQLRVREEKKSDFYEANSIISQKIQQFSEIAVKKLAPNEQTATTAVNWLVKLAEKQLSVIWNTFLTDVLLNVDFLIFIEMFTWKEIAQICENTHLNDHEKAVISVIYEENPGNTQKNLSLQMNLDDLSVASQDQLLKFCFKYNAQLLENILERAVNDCGIHTTKTVFLKRAIENSLENPPILTAISDKIIDYTNLLMEKSAELNFEFFHKIEKQLSQKMRIHLYLYIVTMSQNILDITKNAEKLEENNELTKDDKDLLIKFSKNKVLQLSLDEENKEILSSVPETTIHIFLNKHRVNNVFNFFRTTTSLKIYNQTSTARVSAIEKLAKEERKFNEVLASKYSINLPVMK